MFAGFRSTNSQYAHVSYLGILLVGSEPMPQKMKVPTVCNNNNAEQSRATCQSPIDPQYYLTSLTRPPKLSISTPKHICLLEQEEGAVYHLSLDAPSQVGQRENLQTLLSRMSIFLNKVNVSGSMHANEIIYLYGKNIL